MIAQYTASSLLEQHAPLFWQARQRNLDQRQFVGQGGRLYSVGETLRAVERELRERGDGIVLAHEGPIIDLTNILVQRGDWEAQ